MSVRNRIPGLSSECRSSPDHIGYHIFPLRIMYSHDRFPSPCCISFLLSRIVLFLLTLLVFSFPGFVLSTLSIDFRLFLSLVLRFSAFIFPSFRLFRSFPPLPFFVSYDRLSIYAMVTVIFGKSPAPSLLRSGHATFSTFELRE